MGRFDRPAWPILHCGRFSHEVEDWEEEIKTMSTELTEEEAKSEYAKYFYMGQAAPTAENLLAAERGQELDEAETFLPEDFVKIMTSDRVDTLRTGYRVMNNGIGFAVARIRGEGVTDEMVRYFAEHYRPEGDLFYKTWCPGVHMRHYVDMAVEDVGCGMEAIRFVDFFGPEQLGFVEDAERTYPKCITVSGGNGEAYPLHKMYQDPRPAFSIRYTREIDGGRESLMFYWHGLHWKNGKSVRVIPEGVFVEEADVRTQIWHCIHEQETEFRTIREFWKDRQNTR